MAIEIAAVFTLGNTEEQCIFALERIIAAEKTIPDLFILCGGMPDSGLPESALRLKAGLAGLAVTHTVWRTTQPFSLQSACQDAADLIGEVQLGNYKRVFLGITGGTNPMVAALFHAGMQGLQGEVVALYVQGTTTGSGIHQSLELVQMVRHHRQ